MELPIDHFRLLGVSPSVETEAVLRALQLRLDRPPEDGFTSEVLQQRAEMLKLSADLLSNKKSRGDYEAALLGGAQGLELSSKREVAGLILLWEADASFEAFKIAKRSLQPPQAPALGSGREADLSLLSALACRDAADQEKGNRHYEMSANLLKEGIQLLQRIGKLADSRKLLEQDLEELVPYRILDLLSRDLSSNDSHQMGIELLDEYVRNRGGMEGRNISKISYGEVQNDFELFFQQIRKFLTVQEQVDLFKTWQKRGSQEAGFLASIALVAVGFSRRKPEKIKEAYKYLKSLNLQEIDLCPIIGCMNLILADLDKSEEYFRNSKDNELLMWLDNYPGEILGALCEYCRDWLANDVLPGYRDVDVKAMDLEAWFADRDVQIFIEGNENLGALGIAKRGFSLLSPIGNDRKEDLYNGQIDEFEENEDDSSIDILESNDPSNEFRFINRFYEFLESIKSVYYSQFTSFIRNKNNKLILLSLLFLFSGLALFNYSKSYQGRKILIEKSTDRELDNVSKKLESSSQEESENILPQENDINIEPLLIANPNDEQLENLLQNWLIGKSSILSGKDVDFLNIIARESLVKRVEKEFLKDQEIGQSQIINAKINMLDILDRTSKRIAARATISYQDKRVDKSGKIISETSIPSLKVTYIIGREKDLWQLVDYISGN